MNQVTELHYYFCEAILLHAGKLTMPAEVMPRLLYVYVEPLWICWPPSASSRPQPSRFRHSSRCALNRTKHHNTAAMQRVAARGRGWATFISRHRLLPVGRSSRLYHTRECFGHWWKSLEAGHDREFSIFFLNINCAVLHRAGGGLTFATVLKCYS